MDEKENTIKEISAAWHRALLTAKGSLVSIFGKSCPLISKGFGEKYYVMLIKAFIELLIVCIASSCCTTMVKGVVLLVGINIVNFCSLFAEIKLLFPFCPDLLFVSFCPEIHGLVTRMVVV